MKKAFRIDLEEIEKNAEDMGTMFCEKCHDEHIIFYKILLAYCPKNHEHVEVLGGFYFCETSNANFFSINGKRLD